MLSPQSMSVERFFDREDPEKQFILSVIEGCENPEDVMQNYREGLARINSKEHYDECADSGFFTIVREDTDKDTREEVCKRLAEHFADMKVDSSCSLLFFTQRLLAKNEKMLNLANAKCIIIVSCGGGN